MRCADGQGVLEAATDVFPSDPRPVAFAIDRRFLDGEIAATATATGAGTGLVLRRVGHRSYYAAILDDEQSALIIVRRTPGGRDGALARAGRVALRTGAASRSPSAGPLRPSSPRPRATTPARRRSPRATRTAELQRAGDPGVLATARTLFPSAGPEVLPALGNLHLLPYGVQEGQAVFETARGRAGARGDQRALDRGVHRHRAAARRAGAGPRSRRSWPPRTARRCSAERRLRVATDVPARVKIEVATQRALPPQPPDRARA